MSRVCLTDVQEQARPLPDSNPLDLTDFAGDSGPWRTCSEEKVVEAAGIEDHHQQTDNTDNFFIDKISYPFDYPQ